MDSIEEEGKKYNIVIRGLRKQHKLERPLQLEALVLNFLRQQLGMEDVTFDEAHRVVQQNNDGEQSLKWGKNKMSASEGTGSRKGRGLASCDVHFSVYYKFILLRENRTQLLFLFKLIFRMSKESGEIFVFVWLSFTRSRHVGAEGRGCPGRGCSKVVPRRSS